MTGLVGFTRDAAGSADPITLLDSMQSMLTHFAHNVNDPLWCDDATCATRVTHSDIGHRADQPVTRSGDVHVWLDGCFYNRREVAIRSRIPEPASDAELLLHLYERDGNLDVLAQIDGFYAAAIYDRGRQKIYVTTDRFGTRRLHWARHNGGFWWSSEVKTILALPGYQIRIDPQTVQDFTAVGNPFADRTWLAGVKRLALGEVVTWDLETRSVSQRRYWWWDRIPLRANPIDPNEAAEEMGRLFIKAVERRTREPRANVELSGGLDSRAILAALPGDKEVHTYTSGQSGCEDIRLAAMASRQRGATHHTYEITGSNWISNSTLRDIWRMDGESAIGQVVGSRAHGTHLADAPVRLNGYVGDLIPGGFRLPAEIRDAPINEETVKLYYYYYPDFSVDLSPYAGLRKSDYFNLEQRARRYLGGAIHVANTHGEIHLPWIDNELVEFVYTLPDGLRANRYLYRLMLLQYFPTFFIDIPWQLTGMPITFPTPTERLRRLPQKARRIFFKYARKLGWTAYRNNNPRLTILDAMRWLREEPTRSFAEQVLLNPRAIYPNYVDRDPVVDQWHRHQRGEDHSKHLVYHLSAEIWFQQLLEGNYRPNPV